MTTSKRQRLVPRLALSLDRSGGANPADAAGANINTIIAQYKKHGTLPLVHQVNPLYGDFTFPEDIHSMREAVFAAEERFNELPAKVRTLCDNDWVQFMDRFVDEEGRKTLEDAGLKITNQPIPVVPITNTPTTPPETDPTPTPDPTPATNE